MPHGFKYYGQDISSEISGEIFIEGYKINETETIVEKVEGNFPVVFGKENTLSFNKTPFYYYIFKIQFKYKDKAISEEISLSMKDFSCFGSWYLWEASVI